MRVRSNVWTAGWAVLVISMVDLGCGTTAGEGGASRGVSAEGRGVVTTVDGLIKVETDAPGNLFLRKDHGIGGYDSIAIAPSFINYRRKSAKLSPDDEEIYLVSLEQALVDIAEAANVSIVSTVGDCVIKIGAGFVNVDLSRSGSSKNLGQMTLVIEYQDSTSGQSLLRYASHQRFEREIDGPSREEQIGESFDQMIEDVDIITALRAATAVPSLPRDGCNGTLIDAGR